MKQMAYLFILLLMGTVATNAQNDSSRLSIRGRILNEERQPIEFANIVLLSTDSIFIEGACSRGDGSFEIVPPTHGEYLLQITSIGYKSLCRSCRSGDTDDWILEADAVMLAETVVEARRPVFRLKGGKLETNVRQSLLASLNNANDVLKHIPGLRHSDEGYTVFGKGTPIIYIDHRLLQDNSELERLSAADIEKVELITNPGAEYDATVNAVVRIRTVRGRENGFGGNVRASITRRRRTTHYEQIDLNYRKKGLSLLGMLYARYENTLRHQEVRYQIPSETDRDINSQAHLHHKGLTGGGKASVSYDFGSRHSLGASYEFHRTPDFHTGNSSEYTVKEDGKPTDRTDHSSESLEQDSKHQVNAYYQGSLKQLQVNLTTDFVYGKSYSRQEAKEVSQTEGYRNISSFNRADNRLHAARLLLTHPLWKGELKAGADYTFVRRNDRFLNLQGILPDTDSRIDESKTAVFAEYSLAFGKVGLLAGLRFEHAVSEYWKQGEFISGQSRTYNDWCPNFSVDFPIGKAQANFSYTVKSNRPSFFLLRSTLSYNNRFIYEGGNPLLTPETNHDMQFTALYKWMQFGIGYKYRRNAIAFMTKEYAENPNVVIFTTENFKRMQYLTASIRLSPALGIWRPEFGVYFGQPFFKVTNQGAAKNMNRCSGYFLWQNSLNLPGGWILSLDADYQSGGNFGATFQGSYWGMDAGIRKTFLNKRLNFGLQFNDLWKSRHDSLMLFGPRLTYTKKANPDSRSFSLSLAYRFNAAGRVYKGKHVSDDDLKRL